MNDIKIFSNSEFGEIRTVTKDSEVWFCFRDICKALDIDNVSQAKSRLSRDGVCTNDLIDNLGRKQQAIFINESNLYKTIFQSRKPNAERFTGWVTSEVLPSIRKNGGYIVGQETMSDDELLAKALMVAQNKIAERDKLIAEQGERIEQQSNYIKETKPKVTFATALETSNKSILIRDLAKLLRQNGVEMGEKRLFTYMRNNGYLIKFGNDKNHPTQRGMEQGLFELKVGYYIDSNGISKPTFTPLVTGKGQIYFINKFLKEE